MAKNIMIQGTMSNAGKSIITAGILRVLKQDGYRTAPFKSQNMALNSFITEDGLEMGRAQVMQAEAAGIKPDIAMNPVLLKPVSDAASQVIVNGKVRGNMPAKEYFSYKKKLVPDILEAYQTLDKSYDVIVIEGAGSPAEINLKKEDIVNMGLAKLVDAPVLLAGDIDRGGVFAQLVGTLELLEEKERQRVKGLIINKFRGDKSILDPGLKMLQKRCGIPIAGVIPYERLDLEEEDSLSERLENSQAAPAAVDIAIIRLPHISNFTDFNPLESREDVSVRYVKTPAELKNPDLIILPGTKNTMGDLKWLREGGLEASILKLYAEGTLLFGICGGYQMLGMALSDPLCMEHGGRMAGMKVLAVETIFEKQKSRTRIKGQIQEITGAYAGLSHSSFEGYEIHMGRTRRMDEGAAFSKLSYQAEMTSYEDGCVAQNAAGTYVHGIFESSSFTESFLKLLFAKKGMNYENQKHEGWLTYKNRQYDKLADLIRANMDMKLLYHVIGLS